MKKTIITALALSAFCGLALAQSTQPLFHIERTKNANKLYYEARIGADGKIDAEDPIKVYWIMWAKDSTGKTTEGLNWVERMKVYGFNIKPDTSGKVYLMNLKPFPERIIKIYLQDGKAKSEMLIDGRPSIFQKMLVFSKGNSKPDSIKLYGLDIESGEKRYEKFIPSNDQR